MSEQDVPEVQGPEGKSGIAKTRKSPKSKIVLAAVFLVLIALLVAGGSVFRPTPKNEPIADAPVTMALKTSQVPKDASLGVIVTYGDAEGSGWKDAANGALVATKRFELGGTAIALETRDDHGTKDGARAAVEELAKSKVSGIVIASAGEHVSAALEEAQKAGIPVVLPYDNGALQQYSDVYRTGPSNQDVVAALNETVKPAANPMVLNVGATALEGLTAGQMRDIGAAEDLGSVVKSVQSLASTDRGYPVDAVVINGTAQRQAQLVAELQKAKVSLPIALSPQATSPVFTQTMVAENASLSNELASVGSQSFDDAALSPGTAGQAMNSYLAVLQQMAADKDTLSLAGDREFSEVASVADARAHDAVIALVRAVDEARSTQPQKVSKNLRGLVLGVDDGLTHGTLDFGNEEAFTGDTKELRLSNQDLGLRSTNQPGGSTAQWFAVSNAE
ncbi:ABC transporter substrate-binding protein [Glutamicibacter mishrai]|uniref:ABC transporter substrate-binding protein n=1 Tax=Glutamicibacter mishrai TaxID=1775880 RepID=UPI0020CDC6C1|nr:ABC transporter substrate-binding protein [Glutamicibacter mishrai]UTT39957.1 ABC transporter substrate-binding protein [Glutamicibacter mishrai]